jgi:prepilin-type N-terminal cleavage/methylation domain-containing protein
MRRLVASHRGMTVTEVLIASAIIGTGLVALSATIPLASYGLQEGNQLSTATFLATQRMEQVRNARWEAGPPFTDDLGVSANDTTAPVGGTITTFPDEASLGEPYASYSRTVRITDCAAGEGCSGVVNADLRQVTATVSYRPMTGVGVAPATSTKSAVVTMYITKR